MLLYKQIKVFAVLEVFGKLSVKEQFLQVKGILKLRYDHYGGTF